MFVQSAAFVEAHRQRTAPKGALSDSAIGTHNISLYGQEKTEETIRLCKMNLAVHGLSGDIRQGLTYYVDRHKEVDGFDFVMANPPFNVKEVDKEKLKGDPRYPFGFPSTDNANYLWIQVFYSQTELEGPSRIRDGKFRWRCQRIRT